MTEENFYEFTSENNLGSFDELLTIKLNNSEEHKAVWITTLPELKKSTDGTFSGKPEMLVFYLFDKKEYLMIEFEDLLSVELIQHGYLK